LHHLQNIGEGKCLVEYTIDLSWHSLEDEIEDHSKNQKWASLPIDSRSITIQNCTYSTNTNFSWMLGEFDDEDKKKSKIAGNVAEKLLYSLPISNSLLTL
jgi:hypothetical protein